MKLLSKLTLYTTISKTAIVLLFIALLPGLVQDVASQYTNYNLKEQQKKVLANIRQKGIDYYFEGDSSYGSYTMLKEEYISLELASGKRSADTILTARRIVDSDTLTYRLLNYSFEYKNKHYLLEIGKTITAINQYNRPLQRVALYVLAGLIAFTLLLDLVFTRLMLRPLGKIIRTKLDGKQFPFKEAFLPVKTSTSDFKYLDRSLIELMDQVKLAFEKEREFTSNASHELMTPISILQTKIENLMLQNDINEATQEKIMGMMTTLHRLKKIVRSLLFISRIENDQFARADQVSPLAIINEVINELQERLEDNSIVLQQQLCADLVLQHVNRDLLFQLFYNLINNAIRYNKTGGSITLSEKFVPAKGYTLFIKDTGIGIRTSDLPTIFNRFKKAGIVEGEGYGLGLSIVKSIAQYHSLQIDVASVVGEGTVFSVVFPASLLR